MVDLSEMAQYSRYKGYIPDLLRMLSRRLQLDYIIQIKTDDYGQFRPDDGTWSGLIGDLIKTEVGVFPCYCFSLANWSEWL